MIAYIKTMAVEKKHWLEPEIFRDGVALCQMIPGATAMQVAAYVGLKTRGVVGAGVSFVGFCLPAFLMMMALAALYRCTHNLPSVISVFNGLQAIIVAVVANAALSFGKTILNDWKTLVIACISALLLGFKVNPILSILLAAALGLALITNQSKPQRAISSERSLPYTKSLLFIISISASGFFLLFFFDRVLFDLALLMFRIDLFAFGGGFGSLPLMLHEIVEVRNWVDSHTFMNGIVLGQVTPGPIVITATFVGYLLGGVAGGLIATIGIFLPSFIILVAISPYFDRIRTSPIFNKAIEGVLCSFAGLLLTVTVRFALYVQWDVPHFILACSAFIALILRVDILWVVLTGTAISVVMFS